MDPSFSPAAIRSSRSAIVRARSAIASSAGSTCGAVRTNPAISPAAVPINVSVILLVAAALLPTDRMSIALIGTSRTASRSRSAYPTASPSVIVSPRLHHVNPIHLDSPSAIRTPVTTAATLRTAL